MLKLGIFGGAFDPVHEGHIHAAKLAQRDLALDKVYFLPLNQAVHKKQPYYSAEKRIELLKKAIKPYPDFTILLTDIERGGGSYAVDTIEYLKEQPDFTDSDLYYIIGADAFENFFKWKDPYRLLELIKFIVVARPGYDFGQIESRFAEEKSFLDRIFLIEDTGVNLSSTQIREG